MTGLSEESNLLSSSPEKFYPSLGNLTKGVLAPRICNGSNDNLDKRWKEIAFKQESFLFMSLFESLCLEFPRKPGAPPSISPWCVCTSLLRFCADRCPKNRCPTLKWCIKAIYQETGIYSCLKARSLGVLFACPLVLAFTLCSVFCWGLCYPRRAVAFCKKYPLQLLLQTWSWLGSLRWTQILLSETKMFALLLCCCFWVLWMFHWAVVEGKCSLPWFLVPPETHLKNPNRILGEFLWAFLQLESHKRKKNASVLKEIDLLILPHSNKFISW